MQSDYTELDLIRLNYYARLKCTHKVLVAKFTKLFELLCHKKICLSNCSSNSSTRYKTMKKGKISYGKVKSGKIRYIR